MEMKQVVAVWGRAGGNVTWMAKGSNRISYVFPLQRNTWHKLKGTSRRGQQNGRPTGKHCSQQIKLISTCFRCFIILKKDRGKYKINSKTAAKMRLKLRLLGFPKGHTSILTSLRIVNCASHRAALEKIKSSLSLRENF